MKAPNITSSLRISIFSFSCILFVLSSCNNSGESDVNSKSQIDSASLVEPIPDEILNNNFKVTAQFIQFELGDAPHFIFQDREGEEWDFFACRDTSLHFAKELPIEKANETNQGWSSNAMLQQKWFDIRYDKEIQPLYIDGPEGEVFIIVEANEISD